MYRMLALMLGFMSLFFIACGDSKDSKQAGDSGKQNIRVGMNAEYQPFEFKKDNEIVGFDVDIIDAISKKVGFTYTLNHMSFDGLILALKSNKIDMIISGMSATDERRKQVDFSIPYYEGKTLYIKRKDDPSLTDKDSIKGKKAGVYVGTVQEQAVRKMAPNYSLAIVPSDSIFGAVMNLKSKKVDFITADSATAVGYLKENDDLVGFYEESDGSEGLSIAVDKNKYPELLEKINAAIKELKESGEYDKILEKWDLKLKQ